VTGNERWESLRAYCVEQLGTDNPAYVFAAEVRRGTHKALDQLTAEQEAWVRRQIDRLADERGNK
jgi:hypothetical protein